MKPPTHDRRIFTACAEVLMLALQLRSAPRLPPAAELRQRLQAALGAMLNNGHALGLDAEDLEAARYALVAFIDRQLSESKWAGREEWVNEPLELVLYGQIMAGKRFFERMQGLLESQRLAPLEIYYVCLASGFQGAAHDPNAAGLRDRARQLLVRAPSSSISPHGKPRDHKGPVLENQKPLLGLLAGCSVLVLMVLVAFGWSVSSRLDRAVSSWEQPELRNTARSE